MPSIPYKELASTIDQNINSAEVSLKEIGYPADSGPAIKQDTLLIKWISTYHMAKRMLVQAEQELEEMKKETLQYRDQP